MSVAPPFSTATHKNMSIAGKSPQNAGASWANRGKTFAVKIAFFALILLVWQIVTQMKLVPAYVFPSPLDILQSFREMIETGVLVTGIFGSMSRMLIGYTISVIGGLALGVLAARSWLFKETVGSLILSLQSLPSVCWLPFAVLWVGIDDKAILAVLILGALFSIAVATEGAIRNVPPIYLKVGQVMGARGFTFAKDILFFAALPELVGGLKLGWTFAWRSLMAAELIRTVPGVGHLLEVGRNLNDIAYMMAAMITILGIGLIVDGLVFGTIERKIRRRYGLEKR